MVLTYMGYVEFGVSEVLKLNVFLFYLNYRLNRNTVDSL